MVPEDIRHHSLAEDAQGLVIGSTMVALGLAFLQHLGLVTGQVIHHGGDPFVTDADVIFFVIGRNENRDQAHALRLSRCLAVEARARSQAITCRSPC